MEITKSIKLNSIEANIILEAIYYRIDYLHTKSQKGYKDEETEKTLNTLREFTYLIDALMR